jgi:hypothetical protein
MKKLLLSIFMAFLFLSCENGDMEELSNPFIGTWESEYLRYVFTENEAIGTIKPNDNIIFNGTYVFDSIHLLIYTEDSIFLIHYTFQNNNLIILIEGASITLQKTLL